MPLTSFPPWASAFCLPSLPAMWFISLVCSRETRADFGLGNTQRGLILS